ncbi:MAG: hypothetical protein A2007_00220 [Verrucomicrobia bacterium GWC2_42_7]|nr:MAG: hypothetical protein A2007_00220 [Verrucomicrobia bacterium GWC2_42_7]
MEEQILKLTKAVRSLTEFSKYPEMAANLSADIYFTHPHNHWKRSTNENTNGLLRQYFPKN